MINYDLKQKLKIEYISMILASIGISRLPFHITYGVRRTELKVRIIR